MQLRWTKHSITVARFIKQIQCMQLKATKLLFVIAFGILELEIDKGTDEKKIVIRIS